MRKSVSKLLFKRWLILPYLMLLVFLLTNLANKYPKINEAIYSQTIYPIIAAVLSSISSIFPFSIDDIFYLVLILTLPVLVVFILLKKLKVKKALKIILNILASVYILFYLLWGFNYYRMPLNERLNITEHDPQKQEFIAVLEYLIEETNNSFCACDTLTKQAVDSLIEISYNNLQTPLKIKYPAGRRPDKQITFSRFYSKSGISGYFGPFFNEVHVNKNTPPQQYPHTLAHEKAHQIGITSEAEANFYAWMACSQSNSQVLNYSSNLAILRHFLIQAYALEEYPQLVAKINPEVKKDILKIRQHWLDLRNEKMDKAASKVNDTYLKTNKVKAGIKDYNGVVEHLMNFSLDSAFQERYNLAIK